jgi:small multidrug resistance pump
MSPIITLLIAIVTEVIGTTSLKYSDGVTKPIPSVIFVVAYALSFYFLSVALKDMQIGVAYAIWSGVGLVLTVIAGIILWREPLDWARVVGIFLILAGLVFINVVSKTPAH